MMTLLLISMMVAPALQNELKILDTPDGDARPAPCALTCSGIARWDETGDYGWHRSGSYQGKVLRRVSMSGCNFVSTPVVTASTRGVRLCPSITQLAGDSGWFDEYTVEDSTADMMKKNRCNIHWSAFGYNC